MRSSAVGWSLSSRRSRLRTNQGVPRRGDGLPADVSDAYLAAMGDNGPTESLDPLRSSGSRAASVFGQSLPESLSEQLLRLLGALDVPAVHLAKELEKVLVPALFRVAHVHL